MIVDVLTIGDHININVDGTACFAIAGLEDIEAEAQEWRRFFLRVEVAFERKYGRELDHLRAQNTAQAKDLGEFMDRIIGLEAELDAFHREP